MPEYNLYPDEFSISFDMLGILILRFSILLCQGELYIIYI